MAKCYIELRTSAARGTDSIAADIARHLHTRQHLGRTIVITDQPAAMLAATRKQWVKICRAVQKQRAQTITADKILKFTHAISHMQRMKFTAKSPLELDASVYFMAPDNLEVVPLHCLTIYVLREPEESEAAELIVQLPADALVVDYHHKLHWEQALELQPKSVLEAQVETEWRQVKQFLATCKIDIAELEHGNIRNVEAMDNALDTLLDVSRKFMQVANEFQHTLELARPLRLSDERRSQYDSLALLAHRVQALSPGAFTQQFLESYNEDDTFFLTDRQRETAGSQPENNTETLAEVYNRHITAGRKRLARAMLALGPLRFAPPVGDVLGDLRITA
jgi:hypothetical protein